VEFTLKENGDVEWKFPDSQVLDITSEFDENIYYSRRDSPSLTAIPLKSSENEKALPWLSSSGKCEKGSGPMNDPA
jgi:hypothetical protein